MTPPRITRRRLLAATGVTVGAVTLAGAGLAASAPTETVQSFPDIAFGGTLMLDRVLVAYASRTGSTAEVAEAIGKTLAESGLAVDVRDMKSVTDLTPYRAVVAGSAINGAKWLPEAMNFLRVHRSALAARPFAAFLVCITLGRSDADKMRSAVSEWMAPVRSLVTPVSEGLFAGRLDLGSASFSLSTLMFRAAVAFGALPQGDHRDWNAVRAWAQSTRARLVA